MQAKDYMLKKSCGKKPNYFTVKISPQAELLGSPRPKAALR